MIKPNNKDPKYEKTIRITTLQSRANVGFNVFSRN